MNDTNGPPVSVRAMGPRFFEESIMRPATAVLALLLSVLTSYLLLAKIPYRGPETEIGIVDGPDVNVPYHEKYGLLGYAFGAISTKTGVSWNDASNPSILCDSQFPVASSRSHGWLPIS